MINVLLDSLPEEWESENGEKYPINTDFRIGIQLNLIQTDPDLDEPEKVIEMISLLFDGKEKFPKDPKEMEELLTWFLSGWNHDGKSKKKAKERLMDFDVDQWRIFSEFYAKYGINLNLSTTKMHYWQFMGMLGCLDGAYARVIQIRQQEVDPKLPAKDKADINDIKQVYKLGKVQSKEEREIEDSTFDFLGGNIDWSQESKYIEDFEKYAEVN